MGMLHYLETISNYKAHINNRQTCTDSKNMMDISQQAGSKRKSVSEIKNILCAILHSFQYEKLNNTTAAFSSLSRGTNFSLPLFLDL